MRITALPLFLVIPLALNGCGVVRQAELAKAKEHLSAQQADCRAQHPNSQAERADCITAAENETLRPFEGNDADLLTLTQAKRRVLAAKVDRGEMTDDDAKLEYAQFMAAVKVEAQRRRNADSAAAAQQSAASAQMLGASALMLQASRPAPITVPTPAPTVTTTCMPMGSFVNCRSY
jgi:hypothetical protein